MQQIALLEKIHKAYQAGKEKTEPLKLFLWLCPWWGKQFGPQISQS
jgi:hypothetical protein